MPEDYRFQSLEGQAQPELACLADLAWWEMFDDPALQELIDTALAQNYDARLAMARVAEARALAGVSRSFWLPQVGGTALYQRQKREPDQRRSAHPLGRQQRPTTSPNSTSISSGRSTCSDVCGT